MKLKGMLCTHKQKRNLIIKPRIARCTEKSIHQEQYLYIQHENLINTIVDPNAQAHFKLITTRHNKESANILTRRTTNIAAEQLNTR